MNENYCEDSGSDQEDLVGASASELDDDVTDMDEIQFSFCKATGPIINSTTGAVENVTCQHNSENFTSDNAYKDYRKSKCALFGSGFGLLVTSLMMLVILPLYLRQLSLGGESYNAYGAILYIGFMVAVILAILAALVGRVSKWDIKFYKFPLAPKKLLTLSTCCGLAGTLLTISSYRRVPCHLQDPLKGAALVYSLVFYFFFCRKVMGLQRIFSATTAVVGLFISVDYGLCDEFRCRGADVSNTSTTVSASEAANNVGWQGRAVWTLFYVIGVALWTLHLSMLEGHVITLPGPQTSNFPHRSLLTTVSRIVSNSEPLLAEPPSSVQPKLKPPPKSIHLALWVHGISFILFLFIGLIDIIPGSGQIKSLSNFWSNTGNSFLCNFNIQHEVPGIKSHRETLEYLSNLTPYSILFNRTVQKLRTKRETTSNALQQKNLKLFHTKINSHSHPYMQELLLNHNIATTTAPSDLVATKSNKTAPNLHHESATSGGGSGGSSSSQPHSSRKINTEKHIRKGKNHFRKEKHKNGPNSNSTHMHSGAGGGGGKTDENVYVSEVAGSSRGGIIRTTPIKISHLILKSNRTGDCSQVRLYSWILIFTYISFTVFLYEFLIVSESAVFTIAVVTGALPLIGIYWSVFELTNRGTLASIIWSPEITGELICSLLGTPIIFLGLALLCRAHFHDTFIMATSTRSRGLYSSLTSRIA